MVVAQVRSLTEAQWRLADELRAEWLADALSTQPARRADAQEAITELYRLRGLAPPRFAWVDSPATGSLALWLLSGSGTEEGSPLAGALDDVLSDPLWTVLGDRLRESVSRSLTESIGDLLPRAGPLRDLLADPYRPFADSATGLFGLDLLSGYPSWWEWATLFRDARRLPAAVRRLRLRDLSLGTSLQRTIDRRVHRPLRAAISRSWAPVDYTSVFLAQRRAVRDTLLTALGDPAGWRDEPLCRSLARSLVTSGGAHRGGLSEAGWVARYDLYQRLGVVDYHPNARRRLELLATLVRSAGRWWPHPQVCVIAERPIRLATESVESGRRLHSAEGPALAYRDGFSVCSWHGVAVPPRVISGELTGSDWVGESDRTVRQAMADRMGYDWLLDQVEAHQIATDDVGTVWQLPHNLVLLEIKGGVSWQDAALRRRVVPVPPDQRVPRDAARLIFGTDPR